MHEKERRADPGDRGGDVQPPQQDRAPFHDVGRPRHSRPPDRFAGPRSPDRGTIATNAPRAHADFGAHAQKDGALDQAPPIPLPALAGRGQGWAAAANFRYRRPPWVPPRAPLPALPVKNGEGRDAAPVSGACAPPQFAGFAQSTFAQAGALRRDGANPQASSIPLVAQKGIQLVNQLTNAIGFLDVHGA